MTLHLTGYLLCANLEEADRVSELAPEHIRLTRAEPGCLKFDLFRSHEDPTCFAVSEVFRDRAAFEAHQARTRASLWWAGTSAIRRDFKIEELGEGPKA
jgi:quinol monooxygenase YgiN